METNSIIGAGTSSRNSEVIHAGIYYAKDSVKAKACVDGKNMLYDFLTKYNVKYNNCGKLIVANSKEELGMLDSIVQKGKENGVNDLKIISPEQVKDMEPECHCMGAILSPSTGIVDSHGLMQAFQGDAEDHGAMIAYNCSVISGKILNDDKTEITFLQKDEEEDNTTAAAVPDTITCDNLINVAGLYAPHISHKINNFHA